MALPSMTLAEIRLAAQQRADMVNDDAVSDSEWTTYINGSLYGLYDTLIRCWGEDYFVTLPPYSFTTDGTSDRYALPSAFYKARGIDVAVGGSSVQFAPLREFNFEDRDLGSGTPGDWSSLRFRVIGNYLWIAPRAQSGITIRVWYVPRLTALSSESDSFDGFSGWLDWVVVDAARKALQKDQDDTAPLERELAQLEARINATAPKRSLAGPSVSVDVTGLDLLWPPGTIGPPWGRF